MQTIPHECRPGAPCKTRRLPSWRSRALAVGVALAAAGANGKSASAAIDDAGWAYSTINEMMAERAQADRESREGVRHRRWSASPRNADREDFQPRRSGSLKRKSAGRHAKRHRVASLARDIAPRHLPPLSVVDWARPSNEAIIRPVSNPATPPGAGKETAPGTGNDPKAMVASLGHDFVPPPPSAGPALADERIKWLPLASIDCLAAPLRSVLNDLAASFGPFTVRWTCRNKELNRRVGGAKRSYHLTGNAADFNVAGNYGAILAFLKANKLVGGLKHYGHGAFHIDTGPRRTW
jgi:hypothetical protein